MHILISSAYALHTQKGNSITAKRVAALLQSAGHQATAICTKTLPSCDIVIALHATKTLANSRQFKKANPSGQLIIYLTGTDLYKDQQQNSDDFYEALELADHLVVSQPASLDSIPNQFLEKSSVVPASVLLPALEDIDPPQQPSVSLVGHLRAVKNPFLLNKALQALPELALHAYALGGALDPEMGEVAKDFEREDTRYQWLEDVPYQKALSWIQQSTLMLNTSHSEGGSNAIAESVALGTPVLASKIEGNIGILGTDYSGYFEPDNAASLAQLIQRSLTDSDFLAQLQQQIDERQELFSPERELRAWLQLIQG